MQPIILGGIGDYFACCSINQTKPYWWNVDSVWALNDYLPNVPVNYSIAIYEIVVFRVLAMFCAGSFGARRSNSDTEHYCDKFSKRFKVVVGSQSQYFKRFLKH